MKNPAWRHSAWHQQEETVESVNVEEKVNCTIMNA